MYAPRTAEPMTLDHVARQARRHGYEAPNAHHAHVFCPLCRSKVNADPAAITGRTGDSRVVFPALDSAMLTHLETCTGIKPS